MDALVEAGELFLLEPRWSHSTIALSWLVSFFGAFSTSVLFAQAASSRGTAARLAWVLSASLCLGFGGIFSMHFVGMMAVNLGVQMTFDPFLTCLSALLAVVFSAIALATVSFVDFMPSKKKKAQQQDAERAEADRPALKQRITSYFSRPDSRSNSRRPSLATDDPTEPLLPRMSTDSVVSEVMTETGRPPTRQHSLERERKPSTALSARSSMPSPSTIPAFASANTPPPDEELMTPPPLLESPDAVQESPVSAYKSSQVRKPSALRQITTPSAPGSSVLGRTMSAQSESTESVVASGSSDRTGSGSSSTSSPSWLSHFLTPAAKARLKKGDAYTPEGWVDFVLRRLRAGLAPVYLCSAGVYAVAIVGMHYVGMAGMHSASGELVIKWSVPYVVASCVIAYVDCFVACILLIEPENNILRQFTYALIAATGVCCMHYTGHRAGTFYSNIPADYSNASFPPQLIAACVIAAISVSFVSNTVLAYIATQSRNRLAENILIKRRAWRLLAQKEAAEQANALKTTFISTASHELRSPLHCVQCATELLMRTGLSEEQALYLETIRRACHQLNTVTRSVLDFSKLERGGEERALPEFVDLRECMISVAELCEDRRGALSVKEAQANEVQLLIDIDQAAPSAVYTDEVFLSRIAINLLGNALKFCGAPGYCSLTLRYEDGKLLLRIADCGIGIPSKYLPSLFEPFTQADSSLTRRHAGSGLGLAICKQLVDRLGGKISVDSTEGKGSTFNVTIPIDQVQQGEFNDAPPASKGTLAVFCLHPAARKAVGEMWERYGWQIVERTADDPVEHFATATCIWAEALALKAHPSLLQQMSAEVDSFNVPVFVPYADEQTLNGHLQVFTSPCVVRLKMPIIVHRIAAMLDNPTPYLQRNAKHADRPKLVRFASAIGSNETIGSTVSGTSASSVTSAPLNSPALPNRFDRSTAVERAPPAPLSPPSRMSGTPPPPNATQQEEKPLVLLVEDNPVIAKLGERILKAIGYNALIAGDGQQAVDACLARDNIAGVLMDLQMPVLDGLSATRKIRELEAAGKLSRRLPIIALTANVDSQEGCRAAGCDDFLSKPLRVSDLERALQRHLLLES